MSRDFQFGTWQISGHFIFVEQRVPVKSSNFPAYLCEKRIVLAKISRIAFAIFAANCY